MNDCIIKSGAARIWTVSRGEGMPVILSSGGPGCCDYMGPVAEMLDGEARVIRWEQRGCGRSASVPPFNVETCLEDMENIRRHFGIDRWIVGGHSWGADLSLLYALKNAAHAAGLILISGGRVQNDREWQREYEINKVRRGEPEPDYGYPPNMEVNRQVSGSWKQYIQKPALLRDLSRLARPALFVYGGKDIRPGWAAEQTARLMPDARFERIDGAEHFIWLSHAEELRETLLDFMRAIRKREKGYTERLQRP